MAFLSGASGSRIFHFAPVEFTRQSSDGRMTLVIDPRATPTRLLWAHMFPVELSVAREALRDRESIARGRLAVADRLMATWDRRVHIPDFPNGPKPTVWTRLFGQPWDPAPAREPLRLLL